MKKFGVAPLTLSFSTKQCHDPKNSNNHHCLIATKDNFNYEEFFHLSTIRHWKTFHKIIPKSLEHQKNQYKIREEKIESTKFMAILIDLIDGQICEIGMC